MFTCIISLFFLFFFINFVMLIFPPFLLLIVSFFHSLTVSFPILSMLFLPHSLLIVSIPSAPSFSFSTSTTLVSCRLFQHAPSLRPQESSGWALLRKVKRPKVPPKVPPRVPARVPVPLRGTTRKGGAASVVSLASGASLASIPSSPCSRRRSTT